MYNKCAASQAVCFKAFWLVSRSLSERVPNVSRSCSERHRSKALPECFLTGYKGGFSQSNVSIQTASARGGEIYSCKVIRAYIRLSENILFV